MKDKIKTLLEETFAPAELQVIDQGHKHRNHPEAKKHGGGHFDVFIVSDSFKGQNQLTRHRAVYSAVQTLIDEGHIHALSIKAHTPYEWSQHNV